jgi:hypothetical protein
MKEALIKSLKRHAAVCEYRDHRVLIFTLQASDNKSAFITWETSREFKETARTMNWNY